MEKQLTEKQMMALELLMSGKGYTYKEICSVVEIDAKTLWNWRHLPEFSHFQAEYQRLQDEQWKATVEAARAAAFELCRDKNPKMVEFILKNDGLNPTTKVEAEVNNDITITIE